VLQTRSIQYWRDKRGHEIDFVVKPRGLDPIAIECKGSADELDPRNLLAFRRQYPKGANWVVAPDVGRAFTRHHNGIEIRYGSLGSLVQGLRTSSQSD
jgi:hypothetical protein